MTDARSPGRFPPEIEAEYRRSRVAALVALHMNTFWSTAVFVVAFAAWDAYADPANWRVALRVRLAGAAIIVASGLFQKLPGRARWLPLMARIRLVCAAMTIVLAAALLEHGYGFGIAGLVAIMLTGPYAAIDTRDLLITNAASVIAVTALIVAASMARFDVAGTMVFLLLAVAVSTLLGRALDVSHRRAFALDLELHRDARTDALTGLNNRRAMEERGPLELKRAQRSGTPVSVILVDVDHFKNINDRFGHEAGDAVLRQAAGVLRSALRETDALGRWGGEEFIVVLTDTGVQTAGEVAERMRAAVAAARFEGLPDGATISLGVSTLLTVRSPALAWDSLIKEADSLLYQAKKAGRNRVSFAQA